MMLGKLDTPLNKKKNEAIFLSFSPYKDQSKIGKDLNLKYTMFKLINENVGKTSRHWLDNVLPNDFSSSGN